MSVVDRVEAAVGQEGQVLAVRGERRRLVPEAAVRDLNDVAPSRLPAWRWCCPVPVPGSSGLIRQPAARPEGRHRFGPAEPRGVRRPVQVRRCCPRRCCSRSDSAAVAGVGEVDVAEGGSDGEPAAVRAGLDGAGTGGLGEFDPEGIARRPQSGCLAGRRCRWLPPRERGLAAASSADTGRRARGAPLAGSGTADSGRGTTGARPSCWPPAGAMSGGGLGAGCWRGLAAAGAAALPGRAGRLP